MEPILRVLIGFLVVDKGVGNLLLDTRCSVER